MAKTIGAKMSERAIVDELVLLSKQRPLPEVAAECEAWFTDDAAKYPGKVVADPFKTALNCSRYTHRTCLAVFDGYYLKISPDARWMRALRLYQAYIEFKKASEPDSRKEQGCRYQ